MAELKYPGCMASLTLCNIPINVCASRVLRTGRSGDRMRKLARFLHPSRWTLVPTQPPVQWVPCLLHGREWQQERCADHTPPPSAEIKDIVELSLFSLSGLSRPVRGRALPFASRFNTETLNLLFSKSTEFHFPKHY